MEQLPYSTLVPGEVAPDKCKTTCSESESRNFDSMNFGIVTVLSRSKTNLPFVETNRRHMHRYLCIKCVFNVWHMLKKVCQCNIILNNLWGNKEELNWGMLEILTLRQCWLKVQIRFHWKSCMHGVGHSTAWNIFKPYRPSDRLEKPFMTENVYIVLMIV